MMESNCQYLKELGYSEKQINEYMQSWNKGIIAFLEKYSDSVHENMKYISSYFDSELLLKMPIFYPDTFVLEPSMFKERFDLLKAEFPYDFVEIIEKQFWGYEGFDSVYITENVIVDEVNYIPYMESMSRDDQQIHKAIESIKEPHRRIYKFLVMLNRDAGINVFPEDIEENILPDLEVSKWEVLHNAKFLVEKGLETDIIGDILCYCPFIMMGSIGELENSLVNSFGDDYVDTINQMSTQESWVEKLLEVV